MDRNRRVVRVLTIVVVVLSLVVLYALLIRPAFVNNQIGVYTRGHTQGQVDLLNNMVSQLQNTGLIQIPVGEDQVLVLQGQIAQTTPQ